LVGHCPPEFECLIEIIGHACGLRTTIAEIYAILARQAVQRDAAPTRFGGDEFETGPRTIQYDSQIPRRSARSKPMIGTKEFVEAAGLRSPKGANWSFW
jgi:hypothetical protein